MARNRWLSVAVGGALLAAGIVGQTGAAPPAAASTACPWVGSSAPVADRVSQLVGAMSQAQKLSMVGGTGSGGYVGVVAAIPALCVPALNLEDGPSGVGDGLTGVTQLPAAVSAAATWDTAAEQGYGAVVGAEQAAKGSDVDLGPTVNLVRDPRWGRAFETLGEDPYLTGTLAAAEIRGVQSTGVMAQVKHLAVYNQETYRNSPADDAIVDDRTMQELYLPAFQAAVQQGAASSVMCSYSTVNGTAACQNPYLLNTVLRQQDGFQGFVTSDWGATHATAASANAGMDMEMGKADYYGAPLATALADGTVTQATLNTMVSRILTEMFTFGLFDKTPSGSTGADVSTGAHVSTGTEIAEEGTVLLKNAGGVLPLGTASGSSIAVLGNYQNSGGGSASVRAASVVTPQQGITARAGSGVNVQYAQGSTADSTLADVPASVLTPTSGGGTGLTGYFYNNTTLSGSPVLTRNSTTLDSNWNGASPGTGVNATDWSAKWTGTLKAPATGVYTFATTSDDGSRVILGGRTLVDQWGDQDAHTQSASVTLTAGQSVPIEVDYYNRTGGSQLALSWTPANYSDSVLTQAVALARTSSVAVVFAKTDASEGSDLSDIELPGDQNQLISDVAAVNPHTVVVLNTGSAVTMPWLGSVSAVLDSWYAGQSEGTAIAALLFGDVDPSGKLPVTFPTSLTDVPANTEAQWPGQDNQVQYSEGLAMGYRWYEDKGITPLFPFGYGLSYTSFGYSGLNVTGPDAHGNSEVTATVTNTGRREGADVVQLYLADPAAAGEPSKQLKGFQRVDLAPGASKQVSFSVSMHDLSYWSDSANAWKTATGAYGVQVGDTSGNPQLSGTLDVTSTATGNTVTVTPPPGMSSQVGTAAALGIKGSDSASGQSLTYTATGLPSGLTVNSGTGTVSGTATSAGTSTVTVTATDNTGATGSATFVWTTTAPLRTGPIVSGVSSSLCLDDKAASTADSNPVDIYGCNGTVAQQWTVAADHTLQVLGKCLDVTAAGTANNTLVQLYTCNGTGAQTWQPQADGALLNPDSGRCLDDPAASATAGTQLQIYDCNGTDAQKWTLP
ncbi:glycoside hydrolase family 3 C-terminal domain-containing protein [Streptacidiphilus sp. P02-A3a]|uniref:glycoside hydrolase family 3 C-terminal domain-containing protein n=1 Tax=Streptacidiphilus sp. P02-A3a TaxID=2704468 RepID=UPI0015F970A7|nr:glycoside hydrolase family 3 C-terminal domain-containing protein [Streptacidiphilus sp. P02-A3a]QMU69989.1 glycosyl hydrolase [Streptacidiphilus sp. P02-A3a]